MAGKEHFGVGVGGGPADVFFQLVAVPVVAGPRTYGKSIFPPRVDAIRAAGELRFSIVLTSRYPLRDNGDVDQVVFVGKFVSREPDQDVAGRRGSADGGLANCEAEKSPFNARSAAVVSAEFVE